MGSLVNVINFTSGVHAFALECQLHEFIFNTPAAAHEAYPDSLLTWPENQFPQTTLETAVRTELGFSG